MNKLTLAVPCLMNKLADPKRWNSVGICAGSLVHDHAVLVREGRGATSSGRRPGCAHGLGRRLAAQYVAIQTRSQWAVPELRWELSDTRTRWRTVGGQPLERTIPG
jgi:hypothetical protein